MIKKSHLTGIILAGGNSKRMGQDKGLLVHKNKPFITHIAQALTPVVSSIIVVSANQSYKKMGFSTYPDLIPNSGPLGGLYTGLYYSNTPWNICLSVDIPNITTPLLDQLINTATKSQSIVQCATKQQTHPLVAIYPKTIQPQLKAALDKGHFKLQRLINELEHSNLQLNAQLAKQVFNVNTKEDLDQL